jgi:hypothetical protein
VVVLGQLQETQAQGPLGQVMGQQLAQAQSERGPVGQVLSAEAGGSVGQVQQQGGLRPDLRPTLPGSAAGTAALLLPGTAALLLPRMSSFEWRLLQDAEILPLLPLGLHGGASWLQGGLEVRAEHWRTG